MSSFYMTDCCYILKCCDKFVTCWFQGNWYTYDLRARSGLAASCVKSFLADRTIWVCFTRWCVQAVIRGQNDFEVWWNRGRWLCHPIGQPITGTNSERTPCITTRNRTTRERSGQARQSSPGGHQSIDIGGETFVRNFIAKCSLLVIKLSQIHV